MILLWDENLSPALVQRLADVFESKHVRDCGLARASDTAIWEYAGRHACIIVSKDADFHQRSLVFGPPPQLIWIRRGNATTAEIEQLLRLTASAIVAFDGDTFEALLVLD